MDFSELQFAVLLRIYSYFMDHENDIGFSEEDLKRFAPGKISRVIVKEAIMKLIEDEKVRRTKEGLFEITFTGIDMVGREMKDNYSSFRHLIEEFRPWEAGGSLMVGPNGIEIVRDTDVPAADRFVSRSHNSDLLQQAEETLEKLEGAVRGSNQLFANADERLAVLSEVQAARSVLSGKQIREAAVKLWAQAQGFLGTLARQAKDEGVREIAKRAIALLFDWLRGG